MTNEELDEAVLASLDQVPMRFAALCVRLGYDPKTTECRPVDRSLQRLRKKKRITLTKEGWVKA